MNDRLYRVFLVNEQPLIDQLMRQLKNSDSRHYQQIEWDVLRRRSETMVAHFMIALRDRPAPFVDYIRQIANERIDEGYFLNEILMALHVLEERTWRLTVENIPPEGQIACLARITDIVDQAKDKLVKVYLDHRRQTDEESAMSLGRIGGPAEDIAQG